MESQAGNRQEEIKVEQVHLQEHFSEQIEDNSRLADQILSEQAEAHREDGRSPLFIP